MALNTYLKSDEYGNILGISQIPRISAANIIPNSELTYYPTILDTINVNNYYINEYNQVVPYTIEELQEKNKFQQNSYLKWNARQKVWLDLRTTEQKLEAKWKEVIETRNKLLSESDWIVIRAVDQNQAVPQSWQTYRQALRDITNQQDPFNIVWPIKPEQ